LSALRKSFESDHLISAFPTTTPQIIILFSVDNMDGTKLDNKEKCRQYYQKNKLAIIARVKKYYYAHRCAIAQLSQHSPTGVIGSS